MTTGKLYEFSVQPLSSYPLRPLMAEQLILLHTTEVQRTAGNWVNEVGRVCVRRLGKN